jgi:hypothetical protein
MKNNESKPGFFGKRGLRTALAVGLSVAALSGCSRGSEASPSALSSTAASSAATQEYNATLVLGAVRGCPEAVTDCRKGGMDAVRVSACMVGNTAHIVRQQPRRPEDVKSMEANGYEVPGDQSGKDFLVVNVQKRQPDDPTTYYVGVQGNPATELPVCA